MDGDVEECYVHNVYSKLAAHASQSSFENASQRIWPNVSKFVNSQQTGSIIVDIGCGPNKYKTKNCFMIGVDNCSEVLLKSKHCSDGGGNRDVVIADATNLPFRKDIADAILCVSVLHHFSTAKRRRRVLQQMSDILSPKGSVIIYVWAKEQPYGEFGSQDVLVPWNLHEIPLTGHIPFIRFHKDSTREQRIIANSIPIDVDGNQATRLFGGLMRFVSSRLLRMEKQLPPAIPKFVAETGTQSLRKVVSGIHRWSPMLSELSNQWEIQSKKGRRLQTMQQNVTEIYATELSQSLMEEAMAEALSTLRKVVYYRYYHVFRRGELEEMIAVNGDLRVVTAMYDSANWCVVAVKLRSAQ